MTTTNNTEDVPVDRCSRMGCRDEAKGQVLYRTAKNAPPGNPGHYARYILSERLCGGHAESHAESCRNKGYDAVEVLPL